MPQGDGTGPDGKGPKRENKGWPKRYGQGQCRGQDGKGKRMRQRDGSCQSQTDPSDE